MIHRQARIFFLIRYLLKLSSCLPAGDNLRPTFGDLVERTRIASSYEASGSVSGVGIATSISSLLLLITTKAWIFANACAASTVVYEGAIRRYWMKDTIICQGSNEMMDAATCAPSSINSEMTTFPKTGLVNTSPTVFGLFCGFVALWIPNKCKPACCPLVLQR